MKPVKTITVHCPRCAITIEQVTAETMIYCVVCRKWCRENEAPKAVPPALPITVAKRPRRFRCH